MNDSFIDFIMTYGWAILVVLAGIGALAYFGIFGAETTSVSQIASQCGVCVCN